MGVVTEPGVASIVVSVMDTVTAWTVDIDLVLGTATRRGRAPSLAPQPIAAETLASLRVQAERAYAGGDYEYREQFADGEIEVAITLGSRTVRLRYITAGFSRPDRVEELWAFACTCA